MHSDARHDISCLGITFLLFGVSILYLGEEDGPTPLLMIGTGGILVMLACSDIRTEKNRDIQSYDTSSISAH